MLSHAVGLMQINSFYFILFFFFWCVPRCGTYTNQQLFFSGVCVPRRGTNANQQLLFLCPPLLGNTCLSYRGHWMSAFVKEPLP